MILGLYRAVTALAAPLLSLYLQRRLRRGKEDPARFGERQGIAARPRPAGHLVWVHAASVGEALSMLPLIEAVQARSGSTVLVTTGTRTSAELMAERLPAGAIHQFVPVDRLPWVRRFLDHWRPDLALWSESEFWPNLLVEAAGRHIPLVLLNGRVSDRSFVQWQRVPSFARSMMACFALTLAQSPTDAERLRVLGAPTVECLGNLKFSATPLPVEPEALANLSATLGTRPRWLAASTHAGEEMAAGRIHQSLVAQHPGLLTIIVPRHPPRGPAVAAELREAGLRVALRSAGEAVEADTDVLVADTMGEMGLFIRLAPIVFMGKSLIGQGGQNPLEPARLGAAVLFGPWMDNFAEIAQLMEASGAAERVADEAGLAAAVSRRLDDPALVAACGTAAGTFASAQDGVLDAVLDRLHPWLAAGETVHEGA